MGKVTWTKEQEEYLEKLYSQYLPLKDIVQDKILSKNKYRALGGEKNEFR